MNFRNIDDGIRAYVGAEKITASWSSNQDTIESNFTISNRRIVPSSIRKTINVTSVADTSALKLSVITKNPNVSAAVCNALTVIAPKFVQDAVGVGSINTIDKARVYNNPVGPNVKKNAFSNS